MAQDFAPLLRTIWGDPDWRELSADAQWAYLLLLSHPDRNAAGLVPMRLRKLARLAADVDPQRLRGALKELDAASFVVMDEDTEEVCVRAFIRRGGVYRHIRMLRGALREVSEVESARIRSALGQELARLPRLAIPLTNARMAEEARAVQEQVDVLASMLCDAPPEGMAHPMVDGMS